MFIDFQRGSTLVFYFPEVGLFSFSLVTKSIATWSHYLTRRENIEMRAEVGSFLLISLVKKIRQKVKDSKKDKTHESEITKRMDQNAKQPSSEDHSLYLVDTLFIAEVALLPQSKANA